LQASSPKESETDLKFQETTGSLRRLTGINRIYAEIDIFPENGGYAMAGAIIPQNVRKHGLKESFYIIEQSGDTVNIVSPPGPAKAW
jgi:hypothetical protein